MGLHGRSVQSWLSVQQQNISVLYVTIHLDGRKEKSEGLRLDDDPAGYRRVSTSLRVFTRTIRV